MQPRRRPTVVWTRWLAVAIGALALALGLLVYAGHRPVGYAAGLPAALVGALGRPKLDALSPWLPWLPSLLHPFAFSLFSAALRAPGAPPAYRACLGWWLINLGFELGQLPSVSHAMATLLQASGLPGGLTRPLSQYLLLGTFDIGDIVAATVGAAAAAGLLWLAQRWERHHVLDV